MELDLHMKIDKKVLILFILGATTFIVSAWTLRPDFYFLFDDISFIRKVKFYFNPNDFFHILPVSKYNDRPLQNIVFYWLYQMFGMNYTAYYLVALLWHCANTYLVFCLSQNIAGKILDKECYSASIAAALWFGTYPKNLMAVYWLSGTTDDMLCTTFALLALICYFHYIKNGYDMKLSVFPFFFYVAAMRSKEIAVGLPLIILIIQLLEITNTDQRKILRMGNICPIVYMLVYLIRIFSLPAIYTTEGQYKQEFSAITVFKVLMNYIRMYFGLDDGNFSYSVGTYYTKIGNIGILVCALIIFKIILCILLKRDQKKNGGLLLLFAMSGISLAPVLVLPNVQHMLYLYFPSVWLSMLFGFVIIDILSFMDIKPSGTLFFIAIILMLVINNIGGASVFKRCFIQWGEEANSTVEDILAIEKLPTGTNLYIYGIEEGANVFNYSPGYIVNILYNDPSITSFSVVDNHSIDRVVPYAVWEYTPGHVVELERTIN